MQWKINLSLILLFLFAEKSYSQCSSLPLPTPTCEEAPLICLNQSCHETLNQPLTGWTNFCGPQTAIHNPQFFQFIPISSTVEIHISVDGCNSGNGLQSAIIGACSWTIGDVYACDPGTPPGGTMILVTSELVVGQPAWLLIDGSAGSTCNYTITYTSGMEQYDLEGELTKVTSPENDTIIPQGFDGLVLQAEPAVELAHGYYWVTGWNSDTLTSTDPAFIFDVPCDVPPGLYDICVRAYSGCDTTDTEVCIEIEITHQSDVIKDPTSFCPEAFPFIWENEIITSPGIYSQTFFTSLGCPYDSIWMVEAYPEVPPGQLDTFVCAFEFVYEGVLYDQSGTYLVHYPGAGLNGCDSTVELHVTLLNGLELFIESICLDSLQTLVPHITEHTSSEDSLFYSWYSCDFDSLLSTSREFSPDTSGCYCVVVNYAFCSDTICSTYNLNPCDTNCSLVRDTSCAGESILFFYGEETMSGADFHWLIDLPGSQDTYISDDHSMLQVYHEGGWYHVSLTVVDSFSTVTCSDSFFVIGYTSTASICCAGTQCGACAELTVSLSGTAPWNLYFNYGSSTDTVQNVLTSPYVYHVCLPPDSIFVFYLTVIDSFNRCRARITGDNAIPVILYPNPSISILENGDTLCADISNALFYHWYECDSSEIISTSRCFTPTSSGCYCLEVTAQNGCIDTVCYDFIINSITTPDILLPEIYPNPSNGIWEVHFKNEISFPVSWELVDLWGQKLHTGFLYNQRSSVQLAGTPPTGVYFLKFKSAVHQLMTARVLIQ